MIHIQVALKIGDWKFISILKFAVIFCGNLDSVICQMDKPITQICEVKWLRTRPKVTISIEPAFELTIHWGDHSVCSDIKLPTRDQQWSLYIFLDDGSPSALRPTDQVFNLIQAITDLDPTAPIRIFAWFYYPDRLISIEVLNKPLILRVLYWFNVKSQRDRNFKRVHTDWFVIVGHIQKECFFIGQVEIILKSVVNEFILMVKF